MRVGFARGRWRGVTPINLCHWLLRVPPLCRRLHTGEGTWLFLFCGVHGPTNPQYASNQLTSYESLQIAAVKQSSNIYWTANMTPSETNERLLELFIVQTKGPIMSAPAGLSVLHHVIPHRADEGQSGSFMSVSQLKGGITIQIYVQRC